MSEFDESNLESSSHWSPDNEDTHTVAGRSRVRAQLAADIEAFLSQGGKITELDSAFRSDVPQKAEPGFNNRSV